MVCLQEVEGLDALAALVPRWSELADRDPSATPFQRAEWLLPYCRAFSVDSPWAIAAWHGERLAALLILVLYEDGGRRMATLLGAGRSDLQDALADPGLAPGALASILCRVAERRVRFDALLLEHLPAQGWLATADVPAGLRCADDEDEPCPAVALPADVRGLTDLVAPHVLESARYGLRRLARTGDAEIVPATVANLDQHLAALFELHAARWGARGEAGVLGDARVQAFHADSSRALAAAGLLRGYRLLVDGRAVAAWHGFAERGRVFYYLGGFDPRFRAASPGSVLLRHAVEDAIRRGDRHLDLLRGRERYKYEWGAVDAPALRRVLTPA
jgi:CelD/BcsL family acetyltransferase involved in cellulose biosynthesis